MRIWLGAFALVFALGCGGGSKSATTPKQPPTCAVVADSMVAMMSEGKESTPAFRDTKEGFTTIIHTRCDDDAWSAEAKQCLAAMKTHEDAERCSTMLTDEQQANLVRDEKAKYGAKDEPKTEAESTEPMKATQGAPPPPPAKKAVEDKQKEKPKRSKGSPKPGDPCDGGE